MGEIMIICFSFLAIIVWLLAIIMAVKNRGNDNG
jgi:hypothetical protein